jgi:GMP synthase (glutamine-hydrolysing)
MQQKVFIIDFGSQLTQLIARRVREQNVYCEIYPFYKIDLAFIKASNPIAIILSGGPASVNQACLNLDANILNLDIPILGICYGHQWLVQQSGGKVVSSRCEGISGGEFGAALFQPKSDHLLFQNVFDENEASYVWMSHGDHVLELPKDFISIGQTPNCLYAAIAHKTKPIFGLQFHPEAYHTANGSKIFHQFLYAIAHCKGEWNLSEFKEKTIHHLREKIGKKGVILGLSGGVDSSVTALLLHEAIKDQLHCVFVDNGMLRLNEAKEVMALFQQQFGIHLIHVEAEQLFLQDLKGIEDPEEKRKRIGYRFIHLFEEEAKKLDNIGFLAQGTLYPDVVESVSAFGGPSVTIKSHHNVGGLPEIMNLDLIEPLRELFKDEVRGLGKMLGLGDAMLNRHPFPGPGLAIRVLGEVTLEKLNILRLADQIYLEEIRLAGLYDAIWQAFAVLLPVRTVGVMGDGRTYDWVCALRAVSASDGMTAQAFPFEASFISKVAHRIINEVHGINRVVYDVTSKPPATIEWE